MFSGQVGNICVAFFIIGILGALLSCIGTCCACSTPASLRTSNGYFLSVFLSILMICLLIIGGISCTAFGLNFVTILVEIVIFLDFIPCILIILVLNHKMQSNTSSNSPIPPTPSNRQTTPLNPVPISISVPYDPAKHANYVNDPNNKDKNTVPADPTTPQGELDLISYAIMLQTPETSPNNNIPQQPVSEVEDKLKYNGSNNNNDGLNNPNRQNNNSDNQSSNDENEVSMDEHTNSLSNS